MWDPMQSLAGMLDEMRRALADPEAPARIDLVARAAAYSPATALAASAAFDSSTGAGAEELADPDDVSTWDTQPFYCVPHPRSGDPESAA